MYSFLIRINSNSKIYFIINKKISITGFNFIVVNND